MCVSVYAQNKSIKMSVYFDNDRFSLRKDAKHTLNKLVDSLKNLDIQKIITIGNTDSNADSLYNVKLSQNRTNVVRDYLVSKGIKQGYFTTNYLGENKPIVSNETDIGKSKNRRVDIVVVYKIKKVDPPKIIDSIPVIPKQKPVEIVQEDTCTRDTVIILKSGSRVIFDYCDYIKYKDCLDITENMSAEEAMRDSLTTVENTGIPLASCGMIGVSPKKGCKDICFKKPLIILIPLFSNAECNVCGRVPVLFDIDSKGNWVKSKTTIKVVKIEGKEYYKYEVPCTFRKKNCDCRQLAVKLKVKAPRRYKLKSLTLSSDCPLAVYSFKHGKRKNLVKKKYAVPCFMGKGNVSAFLIDRRSKDTFIVSLRPLVSLKKNIYFARCKNRDSIVERNIFKVFPYKRRLLYRKYKIRKRDLQKYIRKEED